MQPPHAHRGARPARSASSTRARGRELATEVEPEDPLKFRDSKKYRDRLTAAQKTVGEKDALIVMAGALRRLDLVACAFEFRFLGGSMGSVVGERFTRGAEHCLEHKLPLSAFHRAAARACRKACSRCCR